MTIQSRARRDAVTLVVGVLAISLLLGGRVILPRWRGWAEAQATDAGALGADIASASAAARALPGLRDSLRARLARRAFLDSAMIHAGSAAVAAVRAAELLEDIAGDAGVTVASQQLVPDSTTAPGLRRVAVRVAATGSVEAFAALLRAVEGDAHLLRIRELSVAQADPTGGSSAPAVLRIELLVDALCVIEPVARAR